MSNTKLRVKFNGQSIGATSGGTLLKARLSDGRDAIADFKKTVTNPELLNPLDTSGKNTMGPKQNPLDYAYKLKSDVQSWLDEGKFKSDEEAAEIIAQYGLHNKLYDNPADANFDKYNSVVKKIKNGEYTFGVDGDYINSFLSNANNYISGLDTDFKDVSYETIKNLFDSKAGSNDELEAQAGKIKAFLNAHRANIDKDVYLNLSNAINTYTNSTSKYKSDLSKFYDIATNSKDENDYNNKVYSGIYSKYSFDDINKEVEALKTDPKNQSRVDWLNNFKYSQTYTSTEQVDKAVSSAEAELEKVNEELKTARSQGSYQVTMKGPGEWGTDYVYSPETQKLISELETKQRRLQAQISQLKQNKEMLGFTEDINSKGEEYVADFAEQVRNSEEYKNPTPEEIQAWIDEGESDVERTDEWWDNREATEPVIKDPLGLVLENPDYEGKYLSDRGVGHYYVSTFEEARQYHWNEITDDEKDVYYNLLATEGKERATAYLKALSSDFGQRWKERVNGAFEKIYDEHGFLAGLGLSIASIPMQAIGGVMATVGNTADYILEGEINPYSSLNNFRVASEGIRSEAGNSIADTFTLKIGGRNIAQEAYNIMMSMGDSIAGAALLGPAYSFIAGSGAAASTMEDIYSRGGSAAQVFFGGLAAGVTEMLFEKVSIENLLKNADNISESFIKSILKQGGIEASEEILTEFSNQIIDAINMADKSAHALRVDELMAQNPDMSLQEAQKQTFSEQIGDVLWAGIGGFVSGAGSTTILGGANTLSQKIQSPNKYESIGNEIIKVGESQAIVDFASSLDNEAISKILVKTINGQNLSAKNLGKLANEVNDEIGRQIKNAKTEEELVSVYDNLSNSTQSEFIKSTITLKYLNAVSNHPDWFKNKQTEQAEEVEETETEATSDFEDKNFESEESVLPDMSAAAPESDVFLDTAYADRGLERLTDEQKQIKAIGKALGREVEFRNLDKWIKKDGKRVRVSPNGYFDKNTGKIFINNSRYANVNGLQFVIKHELTHFAELSGQEYTDFFNGIMDSKAFKDWVKSRGFKDTVNESGLPVSASLNMNKEYRERYSESGLEGTEIFKDAEKGEIAAYREMVSDFVAENLFKNDLSKLESALSNVKPQGVNKFKQVVLDLLNKLKAVFKNRADIYTTIEGIESKFVDVCKSAQKKFEQKNTPQNKKSTGEGGKTYSIVKDSKGRNIVLLDRNMFKGITDLKARGDALENWILNTFGGDKYDTSDYRFILVNERTAGKMKFWNENMDETAYEIKLSAAEHIDELIKLSKHDRHERNFKDKHKEFAKHGWDYFKTYFTDGTRIYEAYMSAAKTDNGSVLYNIGNIKDMGNFESKKESSYSLTGSPNELATILDYEASNKNSNNRIAQNEPSVNNYSMPENKSYSLPDNKFELLRQFKEGQLNEDEIIAALENEPRENNPISAANLKPEDANTTPTMTKRRGQNKGDKESNLYGSLLGSEVTDDAFKRDMLNDEYIRTYQSVANTETLKKAAKELDEGGRDYVEKWKAKDPDRASLIDITVGLILIDRYQRVGNTEGAIAAAQKVREMGTASGRQVQIFSILGRYNPDTMVAYAQRELQKALEIISDKKTKEWIDANKAKFQLTADEIEKIRRNVLQAAVLPQDSREKAILLSEICTLVQDKIPPKVSDSIKAWQRISMLLNVKTNIRNVLGNAGMAPVFIASDYFGTLIDKAVSKKTGIRTTGGFNYKGSAQAFSKGLWESWDDFKRGVQTKQQELNRFEIEGFKGMSPGKNFNENTESKMWNAIAEKLNGIDRFTSFLLEAGDRSFFEMWLNNSLKNQMRLNNTTTPTPEMLEVATEVALQRTWQDKNKMTKIVTRAKSVLNEANIGNYGLGDVIIKFTKTPANLSKAMADFSPLGFAFAGKNALDLKRAWDKGDFTPLMQQKLVSSISNATVGTLIYLAVYALATSGIIKLHGAGDDDKDVSNFEKYTAGMPPYSIEFLGTHITYDWAQPFGSILAIVSEFMENREDKTTSLTNDILQGFLAGGEVFLQQSFLKSLYEFFSNADKNLLLGLKSVLLSDLSVFIPQFMSQVASFTDPKRRVTYNKNEFFSSLNQILVKLPGFRRLLPAEVNVMGEEIENNQYLDPWHAFASPWNEYPSSYGKTADTIYELYKETGDKTIFPRVAPYKFTTKGNVYNFTAKEKLEFQKNSGKASAEMLEILFSFDEYKTLNDAEKSSVINDIYNYSVKIAKFEHLKTKYDYELLSDIIGYKDKDESEPILTEDKYSKLTENAKLRIIEEELFSKYEMRFNGYEDAVKYYIRKAKK